jgi:RNA polymerase sigma-70 factor (ECF subfamily)
MNTHTAPAPPEELENLFHAYYDPVFRMAYRVTGNTEDAEDVLQTIFLRLLKRDEEVDLQPSPKAYLMRAAVNASLDVVRGRTRRHLVDVDDVAHELFTDPETGPEQQQQAGEMRDLLRRAVAKLEGKSAQVFVLRYFEDYGNREIAELLGMSPLVVGVMLHRSRAKVRQTMGALLEN